MKKPTAVDELPHIAIDEGALLAATVAGGAEGVGTCGPEERGTSDEGRHVGKERKASSTGEDGQDPTEVSEGSS